MFSCSLNFCHSRLFSHLAHIALTPTHWLTLSFYGQSSPTRFYPPFGHRDSQETKFWLPVSSSVPDFVSNYCEILGLYTIGSILPLSSIYFAFWLSIGGKSYWQNVYSTNFPLIFFTLLALFNSNFNVVLMAELSLSSNFTQKSSDCR